MSKTHAERFADIFGDDQDTDDVSLESALAASKMPKSKTVKVSAFDYEIGMTYDYVTVYDTVDNEPKPAALQAALKRIANA